MKSVVYLQLLKWNDHPLNGISSLFPLIEFNPRTMIPYSIPITSIYTTNRCTITHNPIPITSISSTHHTQPSHNQPHTKPSISPPYCLTISLFTHSAQYITSSLTSDVSPYTTHLLQLSSVPLFQSLFILLIWTTFTFHSYCYKLSHNLSSFTSIHQQTQPCHNPSTLHNPSHFSVAEPFLTCLLSPSLNTTYTLTSTLYPTFYIHSLPPRIPPPSIPSPFFLCFSHSYLTTPLSLLSPITYASQIHLVPYTLHSKTHAQIHPWPSLDEHSRHTSHS